MAWPNLHVFAISLSGSKDRVEEMQRQGTEWGRQEQRRCTSILSGEQSGRFSQLFLPHGWVRRSGVGCGLVAVPDGGQTVLTQESRTEPLAAGHTLSANIVQP